MIRGNPISRRARIDRRIISLRPVFEVITRRITCLGLGDPDLTVGPAVIDDRIRTGAVWFIKGINHGFHVDFMTDKIVYEAWTSERRVTITVTGKATGTIVDSELRKTLTAAGLNTGCLHSSPVMPVTGRKRAPLSE